MGRLVEQGLRKLVNRLIALNDERRDFSGRQDGGGEEGAFFCSSVARLSASTDVHAVRGAADKGRGMCEDGLLK